MIAKAELHVHLEGTIHPATAKCLAKKNRIALQHELFAANDSYKFRNFQHFMQVYDEISKLIRCDEDYSTITYEYLASCAKHGAIYIEIMCAPDLAMLNQINYHHLIAGMTDGIDRAKQQFDIEARILVTIVRNFGVKKSFSMVEQTLANPHPYVVGLGIAGDEINYPCKNFSEVFQLAHNHGLQCTAHAGEFLGPESVWQAIEYLPVTRIGHGVRASEDPQLIQQLINRKITLEVCPGSNIVLGVYPSLNQHPFKKLLDQGVAVCLNSDDPPFFGTTLDQEYATAKNFFGLNDQQLRQVTLNAIEASFADEETKQRLREKV